MSKKIEDKFFSLINKLDEVAKSIDEVTKTIKEDLTSAFENHTEELRDMINRFAEAIGVEAQKFDDQTNFLIRNFNVGIDSIKNTFDIKRLDRAINKIDDLSQNILSGIDLDKMREGLKLLAKKVKTG
ncbi:MAG: hypothetical protein ACFE7E_00380 [Candidatus Hodarchaeota archaeon]